MQLHVRQVTGVQHKNIDWSLWEGNFEYMLPVLYFSVDVYVHEYLLVCNYMLMTPLLYSAVCGVE